MGSEDSLHNYVHTASRMPASARLLQLISDQKVPDIPERLLKRTENLCSYVLRALQRCATCIATLPLVDDLVIDK